MKFLIAILLSWMLSWPGFAADIPSRIEISYHVSTDIGEGEINEVMEMKHTKNGHSYTINSEAQATGLFKLIEPNSIIRHSEGIITRQGLRPTRAYEKRGKKEPSLAVFDWEKHMITLQHDGQEVHEKLPASTIDRLSLSYNFIFAPLPKHHVDRHVTNGQSLRLSHYKVSKETIETPIGKMETIVLTRQEAKHSKLKRKLWLALNNHMLPVRIVSVEENGREIDKIVTGINISYQADH
ncbi:DUF3108 domain-containing protein [Nitrosomonas sp. JL21]|uniref:DUF3108 domain-containing protein n=1 Tax=Nitrosomonas sp. JL21 TaxID=153949 RepID=UPI00136A5587|nr:DUF3108 domain-containing protein [Nitrosomonas sp. JL21]MBL8497399.1 DUF3108 domain-containing protein [Nitrosomonas sp.]MXS78715.1 DUF3108 domain-containing protein [Nitrosomonas sp. JL21]